MTPARPALSLATDVGPAVDRAEGINETAQPARVHKLRFHQFNCRHSAAAQGHFIATNARSIYDVFLLQEPYVYKGLLTALPANFLAFHAVPPAKAWAAIVAHRQLNPIASVDTVHECWVQVELQVVRGTVASGYCSPKGDILQQLCLFSHTAMLKRDDTRQWVLLCADVNAYHEAWGSQPTTKSETVHSVQWRRGLLVQQWLTSHSGLLLNDEQATTYCSDKGSTSAIDISVWWATSRCSAPHWSIATTKHLSDHYPITIHYNPLTWHTALCDITSSTTPPFPHPPRQARRITSDDNRWPAYRAKLTKLLDQSCWPLPELHADDDTRWLQQQLLRVWPYKFPDRRPHVRRHPWWTPALRRARRQYWKSQKNLHQASKGTLAALRTDFHRARISYRQSIRLAQKTSWTLFLSNLANPWGAYYKYLRGSRQRRLPLLTADLLNPVAITPPEFLKHFAAQLSPQHNIPRLTTTSATQRTQVAPLTTAELTTAILQTSYRKAAGSDGLPPIILHRCGDILQPFLMRLMGKCLQAGHFPGQ